LALRADLPVPALHSYLRGFGDGEDLDFVHLSCLARGWAGLPADLRADAPRGEIAERIEGCRTADGGYADTPGAGRGTLYGGFYAAPAAPIPDLLSTATALHALAGMRVDLEPIKEPCLDFIDSLWVNRGAFFGTWMDDEPDCEYTYYALLALGHLSL